MLCSRKGDHYFERSGDKDLQKHGFDLLFFFFFFLLPPPSPRAASTSDLEPLVSNQFSVAQCTSIEHALDAAHRFEEKILVTGSLFLVGETLATSQLVSEAFQISRQ